LNLTRWQRLGRFVGKTFSFSKCDPMHEICPRIFLHDYTTARCPPERLLRKLRGRCRLAA
jgi:hypothetical protein